MEPRVSSSRGPMSSLLRKLDSILECQQLLRSPVREDFELLREDLAGIDAFLLEISDEDDPNLVKKYWMKEVREICYDAEDFIDSLIHSVEAKIGSVGVVPRFKISQLPSRTRTPRPRLKIRRLPRTVNLDPLPNIASQIKELRARLEDAAERHKRYVLDNNTAYSSSSSVHSHSHWIPEWYRESVSILVGIDDSKKKLINLLNNGEKKLNIISIYGLGGIGKTTLAKQILQELGWQFGCHGFVRASRKPDTRSLLRSILSQTGWCNHSEACNLQQLIDHLNEHLRRRRYLIVIDDLWDTTVWDFLLRAFPDGTLSSRIIITTTSENIATTCCGNRSDYILKMEPLNDDDSRKIFFARVFGSENKCPQQFKDASFEIVRKCAGVPLAVIHIAGLLTHQQDKSEEWDYVERSLGSNLSITPTFEGIRKVINLSYNGLPQCLKTCLQYLCMYPENCTIWKEDLVRRWVAEGFIEGDSEVIAQSHFEELVYRGMIHPTDIDYNEQVLSCTVHHMILDFVRNKSAEDNFVTAVDYSQNTRELSSKVRRLFLFYSNAKYATKLLGITLLQVRSLAFYGLVKCLPSIQEFKFLRVLVLHLWGDYNDSTILNLSGINKLFQLRYLKVTCNCCLQLPSHMGRLHRLETLEINAIVTSVPEDIIDLKYLVHLSLPLTKLPFEVCRLRSLRTLKCFDFCGNLDDEVKSLQELSCLEELQLVLTAAPSDSMDRNLKVLFSILGCLYELKSLVIVRSASVSKDSITIIDSSSTSCPKDCLERLELLRGTCILRSIPKWIGQLGILCILKLGVLELLKNDVDSFAGLQSLKFLSLYVRRPTAEPIIISSGAFPALEHFKFKSGVLCIAFRPGAMPKLHRLKLSFNAYSGVEFGGNMIVGIEHLLNLQEVSGRIGVAVGSKESDKRTAESKLKNAISKHSMIPRLNIQVVDWIEEDRVPAGDIMASEMQVNKLSGDHGFLGEKSEVNTNKVDECRTSSLFLDAVVTASDVLNSDDKRKKSDVDVSKSTGTRLSTTNIMSSYSAKSFYRKAPRIRPLDGQLELDDLDVIKVIWRRSSGNLQLVRHKFTGQIFVLKVIELNIGENVCRQIANELKLSCAILPYRYIVVFYQCFYVNGTISIVLEYMDGGSLADFLKTVKTIPEDYLAAICKKILKGLIYLHNEKHIIHRDLKPSNILINHRGEVKISDFGASATISSSSGQRDTFVGTYCYMSPERICGKRYGFVSDIWSLGLVLLECATGTFPFGSYDSFYELLETIVEGPPPSASADQFTSDFCSFISACMQKDANDRSTAQVLLEHPFLSMYDDLHVDLASYFTSAGSPHFYELERCVESVSKGRVDHPLHHMVSESEPLPVKLASGNMVSENQPLPDTVVKPAFGNDGAEALPGTVAQPAFENKVPESEPLPGVLPASGNAIAEGIPGTVAQPALKNKVPESEPLPGTGVQAASGNAVAEAIPGTVAQPAFETKVPVSEPLPGTGVQPDASGNEEDGALSALPPEIPSSLLKFPASARQYRNLLKVFHPLKCIMSK